MADEWGQTNPGWVPPPDGQPPLGHSRNPARRKRLIIATLVLGTGAVLVTAIALLAIWRAVAPPAELTEREWGQIEEVRDAVPAPVGFEKDHERRYGGDGCNWGPSCEGEPESSQYFNPSSHARLASCDDLRALLSERFPGTFTLEKETAHECLLSAELGGLNVTASLYSRDATQWYIVTAGDS
jgi:hypothetical protein